MKTFLILGAGTAGTMMANKLAHHLDQSEWRILIVDKDETHYYQPGFLFIPFGIYGPDDVRRAKRRYLPQGVEVIFSGIERIEPDAQRVILTRNSQVVYYDQLIIATGTRIVPEETPGLKDAGWRQNVFDFYTFDGAVALSKFLRRWPGGRVVVNVAEMPIKCPVAPLEFLFLAHAFFHERGMRDKVEIVYATPLPGAFTKPRTAAVMGDMLKDRGIHLESEFNISEVDNTRQVVSSYDGRELNYDLLVTIPVHMGSTAIQNSGIGDALHFVPTDKQSLQSKKWPNVWVIGDATNLPSSKAGSVAHFEADILIENVLRAIDGLPPSACFDGHANCFIESGFGKGFLIDFNYDTEPLPGKFPMPGVGPFDLLKESEANHWGKVMFRWMYWNLLLRGAELPFESQMSMVGKVR
ncbi:MAG TPA: FAD/NAD(P)-binding oxidoreductase [Anaerolineales bacterium]|nr:FAD/NAD(P)-binding oxidoreductase [Anaerolineales bacterium]